MQVGGRAGGWTCRWVDMRVGVVCEQAKERDNQSCCTHLRVATDRNRVCNHAQPVLNGSVAICVNLQHY